MGCTCSPTCAFPFEHSALADRHGHAHGRSRRQARGATATVRRAARWAAAAVGLILASSPALAQSEDPSDATPSLISAVNNTLSPALPVGCTGASSNGPYSMSTVSTVTANTPALPFAPCSFTPTPYPPSAPKDIWFRLDPAFPDAVYRFTLIGSAPAMTKGGIALYEAPSAAGPFRLLSCSLGGSLAGTMASAEATGLTGGKIYVRVWDYTPNASSSFTICILGQRTSTMPDRGADETPCTARTLAPVAAFNTSNLTPPMINFVYAREEAGLLLSGGNNAGGDLWVKLQVPASGNVILKASYGTSTSNQIGSGPIVKNTFGMSAYLVGNCADYSTFKEVGWDTTLVTPAGATASSANLTMKCLPAGAMVYVRLYGTKESAGSGKVKRFGQMRLEWMAGPLPYPGWTAAANYDPCGATDLVMDAPCGTSAVTGGDTRGGCTAPGVPTPTCGGYSGQSSVWHKFTAPISGMVQIDAAGTMPVPITPRIALYTSNDQGCDGRMALVACDDRQGPGINPRIIKWNLVPGQTYYVRTWSTGAEGTFSLCVKEPQASPGNCLYMIDLWAESVSGPPLTITVSIDGGPPVPYSSDPSGSHLVEIPIGSSADFHFSGTGGTMYFYAVWQAGWLKPIWWGDGGYGVFGPQPTPVLDFHVPSACVTEPNKSPRDCDGMRTICLDPASPAPLYMSTGNIRHGTPLNDHNMDGAGSQPYQGYTFSEGNGYSYDLAGANMGCLDPESSGINWLVFRPTANGTVSLMFQSMRQSEVQDMDFAIWDMGLLDYTPGPDTINHDVVCPPQTAPIRCSSARVKGFTGMLEGRTETVDGHGGYGFLAPLPVQTGHGYLIALTPQLTYLQQGNSTYFVNWTMYRNALGVSDPSIVSCATLVLPVELLYLAGVPEGDQVRLTWATATEKNSSHFIVERSTNNLDFVPIGHVNAAGNSTALIDYTFMDPHPMNGVNYYRLQLVDLNGSTERSNKIAVMFTGDGQRITAWPNPVHDKLNVSMDLREGAAVTVHVVDALGRTVRTQRTTVTMDQPTVEVAAEGLAPGSYVVHFTDASNNPIGSARFVKD